VKTQGPPPLAPFGLVLHRDGRWTHEGHPILNRRLREAFDRGVCFLPEEGEAGKYVVRLGRYRGEIEIEETGFFVRAFDPASGEIEISDGSVEVLVVETLRPSPHDGALICSIKPGLREGGVPARFSHAAQSHLLTAVEERGAVLGLVFRGHFQPLPAAALHAQGGGDGEAATR